MLDKKNMIRKANYLMYRGTPDDLSRLEKDLTTLIKYDNDPRLYITLAKVYFEEKKYHEALQTYLEVLRYNNSQSIYLGLFKVYVQLREYENANIMLSRYKFTLDNSRVFSSELLDSALNAINSNLTNFKEVTNKTSFMYEEFKSENLKSKYAELIDCYNNQDFAKCTKLAKEIQVIVEEEQLSVEFNTLSNILSNLQYLKSQQYRTNQQQYIEEMIANEDYDNLLYLVSVIVQGVFTITEPLKKAIKTLVLNGYADECRTILNKVVPTTSSKENIKYLQKLVNEYAEYYDLPEELKGVYQEAVIKGSYLKGKRAYTTAYDVYTWAYYLTSCNIFKYYIGQTLYWRDNREEAYSYFEDYLKTGVLKQGQAKHYLPKKNDNRKKYQLDPDEDVLKLKMQRVLRKEPFFEDV